MIEYKFPSIVSIFIAGLLYTAISYATIPLIDFIYGQNMIKVIATIFGLGDYAYLYDIVPSFILVLGLIQSTITYGLILVGLPKLGINNEEHTSLYLYEGVGLFGSALSFLGYFFFAEFSMFFLIFALFFGVYEIVNRGFKKEIIPLVIDGVCVIIFILIFALLYQYMRVPFGILLVNLLFDMFLIVGLVYNTFTKRTKSLE